MLGPLGVKHNTLEFLLTTFTFKGKYFTKTSTQAKGIPINYIIFLKD